MKYLILASVLLTGCATNNYATYIEAQKSISRDATVAETARIAALLELSKSPEREVKVKAIEALQDIQRNKKDIVVQQPRNWLGF
jgi:predicted outer membrane protein